MLNDLWGMVHAHLDIPRSYYERARDRHRSLGEWLCRPESRVSAFNPEVHLQGSFRYGTVIKPLLPEEEYDLDDVAILSLSKAAMTQEALKNLYGDEIKDYARAHGMIEPVKEKNRCWELRYTDEVAFHLDSLPCLPEDRSVIEQLILRGVPEELAARAVAITDRRHPYYRVITHALLSSNPRGFALWFEQRARPVAQQRMRRLVEARAYASVDDVPPYEWKTPLQVSIQLLKRHRDVMFREHCDLAPISMIITNLATHSYSGETDVAVALVNLVDRMPLFVRGERPRVPNPANPAEDYADKWAQDARLEEQFWAWHAQVKADLARLSSLVQKDADAVAAVVRDAFAVDLTKDERARIRPSSAAIVVAPAVRVISGPRPWQSRE